MSEDVLSQLYKPADSLPPGEPFLKKYAKKIGAGLAFSFAMGVLTNLPYLKTGAVWVAHAVVMVFGHEEPPSNLKKVIDKAQQKAEVLAGDKEIPPAVNAGPVARIRNTVTAARESGGAVAKVGETVEKAKEKVGEGVEKAKEVVTDTGNKIADAVRNNNPFRDRPGGLFPNPVRPAYELVGPPKPEPTREDLLKEWRAKVNATCPMCRKAIHVKPVEKHKDMACPSCNGYFRASVALAKPPPMPPGFRGFKYELR